MSEIENGQEMINEQLLEELKSVPEIAQALELTKESAYSKAELEAYDKYWDTIRTEKTIIADAEAKGEQIGIQKGELKKEIEVILNGFDNNISISILSNITQVSEEKVIKILKDFGKL